MAAQDLDTLFPLPSLPPSALSPIPGPGVTRESAEALVRLLKENHTRFHCYFNDKGYHKWVKVQYSTTGPSSLFSVTCRTISLLLSF